EVAELLQIDPNTVRNHFKRYRTEGLAGLNRVGVRVSPCSGCETGH
ncbi:MAG: Mobile element protein, partial [Olavius algarvensis Gamma 1 endosymbiont]